MKNEKKELFPLLFSDGSLRAGDGDKPLAKHHVVRDVCQLSLSSL